MEDEFLTIEESVNRGDNGELLAIVVPLLTLDSKKKIKAIPLSSGQLKGLESKKQLGEIKSIDNDIIKNHCLQPKYKDEDFEHMSTMMKNAIVFAIMSISTGISQEEMKERTLAQVLDKAEEELKKKEE